MPSGSTLTSRSAPSSHSYRFSTPYRAPSARGEVSVKNTWLRSAEAAWKCVSAGVTPGGVDVDKPVSAGRVVAHQQVSIAHRFAAHDLTAFGVA